MIEPNTDDLEDEICEGPFGPDSDDDEDGAADAPAQPPVEEEPATGSTKSVDGSLAGQRASYMKR